MKQQYLAELASVLPVREFILVYFVQREEYNNNLGTSSRPVTQTELEQFYTSSRVRLALYRLQGEGKVMRVEKGCWVKKLTSVTVEE